MVKISLQINNSGTKTGLCDDNKRNELQLSCMNVFHRGLLSSSDRTYYDTNNGCLEDKMTNDGKDQPMTVDQIDEVENQPYPPPTSEVESLSEKAVEQIPQPKPKERSYKRRKRTTWRSDHVRKQRNSKGRPSRAEMPYEKLLKLREKERIAQQQRRERLRNCEAKIIHAQKNRSRKPVSKQMEPNKDMPYIEEIKDQVKLTNGAESTKLKEMINKNTHANSVNSFVNPKTDSLTKPVVTDVLNNRGIHENGKNLGLVVTKKMSFMLALGLAFAGDIGRKDAPTICGNGGVVDQGGEDLHTLHEHIQSLSEKQKEESPKHPVLDALSASTIDANELLPNAISGSNSNNKSDEVRGRGNLEKGKLGIKESMDPNISTEYAMVKKEVCVGEDEKDADQMGANADSPSPSPSMVENESTCQSKEQNKVSNMQMEDTSKKLINRFYNRSMLSPEELESLRRREREYQRRRRAKLREQKLKESDQILEKLESSLTKEPESNDVTKVDENLRKPETRRSNGISRPSQRYLESSELLCLNSERKKQQSKEFAPKKDSYINSKKSLLGDSTGICHNGFNNDHQSSNCSLLNTTSHAEPESLLDSKKKRSPFIEALYGSDYKRKDLNGIFNSSVESRFEYNTHSTSQIEAALEYKWQNGHARDIIANNILFDDRYYCRKSLVDIERLTRNGDIRSAGSMGCRKTQQTDGQKWRHWKSGLTDDQLQRRRLSNREAQRRRRLRLKMMQMPSSSQQGERDEEYLYQRDGRIDQSSEDYDLSGLLSQPKTNFENIMEKRQRIFLDAQIEESNLKADESMKELPNTSSSKTRGCRIKVTPQRQIVVPPMNYVCEVEERNGNATRQTTEYNHSDGSSASSRAQFLAGFSASEGQRSLDAQCKKNRFFLAQAGRENNFVQEGYLLMEKKETTKACRGLPSRNFKQLGAGKLIFKRQTNAVSLAFKTLQQTMEEAANVGSMKGLQSMCIQFLGNLVSGNCSCQEAVWKAMFPNFAKLCLQKCEFPATDLFCMVIFNCMKNRHKFIFEDGFMELLLLIIDHCKENDAEWGEAMLIPNPRLPFKFVGGKLETLMSPF
eukprot:gene6808-7577_t